MSRRGRDTTVDLISPFPLSFSTRCSGAPRLPYLSATQACPYPPIAQTAQRVMVGGGGARRCQRNSRSERPLTNSMACAFAVPVCFHSNAGLLHSQLIQWLRGLAGMRVLPRFFSPDYRSRGRSNASRVVPSCPFIAGRVPTSSSHQTLSCSLDCQPRFFGYVMHKNDRMSSGRDRGTPSSSRHFPDFLCTQLSLHATRVSDRESLRELKAARTGT